MIKAIIFDIGGVILDMSAIVKPAIEVFHPEDNKKFWEELNIEAIPLCRGDISMLEFWKNLAKRQKKKVDEEILKNLWVDKFEDMTLIDNGVKKLIINLKKKYKLAVISNSIKQHSDIIKKTGLYDLFDVVVLSHEVRMTKENQEIFLLALKELHLNPDECVFIDDIPLFVDTANKLGMKGIIFRNIKELKTELKVILG